MDSNPQPLECESLPITTRPGLPPKTCPNLNPACFVGYGWLTTSHHHLSVNEVQWSKTLRISKMFIYMFNQTSMLQRLKGEADDTQNRSLVIVLKCNFGNWIEKFIG